MSFVSSINKKVGSGMAYTIKNLVAKNLEQGVKEPATYAAKMLVTSLVTKDAIGCALYTYQSYNNKKIPDERRGFVAAMDFMNGIINVGGQIAAFMCVERLLTPKIAARYTGYIKDLKTNILECVKSKAPMANDEILKAFKEVLKEKRAELIAKGVDVDAFEKNPKKVIGKLTEVLGKGSSKSQDIAKGVGIVVSSLATTALIKRALTPLIATPLAGWFNDKYMNKKPKKQTKDRMYYEVKSISNYNTLDKHSFGQFAIRK